MFVCCRAATGTNIQSVCEMDSTITCYMQHKSEEQYGFYSKKIIINIMSHILLILKYIGENY